MPPDSDRTLRALVDPARRALLDALRLSDGQTVSALGVAACPGLGRHAVLKHLGVLEDAGLVTTHKRGRQRFVHLNAVPIVDLARRWLDDYTLRDGLTLSRLRDTIEERPTDMPDTIEQESTRTIVSSVVIAATTDEVWRALTDPAMTTQWFFGTEVRTSWEPGAALEYFDGEGNPQLVGVLDEVKPGELLTHTFRAVWDDDVAADPESHYEWRLEPIGERLTRLTVTHSGIPLGTATDQQVEGGAAYILSALKTLLETGKPLG